MPQQMKQTLYSVGVFYATINPAASFSVIKRPQSFSIFPFSMCKTESDLKLYYKGMILKYTINPLSPIFKLLLSPHFFLFVMINDGI